MLVPHEGRVSSQPLSPCHVSTLGNRDTFPHSPFRADRSPKHFCLFDFCFLFVCRIAAPCPGSLRASAAAGRHSSSARAGRSTGAPRSLKPSHPAFAWTGKRERRGVNRGFTDSGSLQRSPFADSNPPELHPQRFCSIVALKEARSDFNP